MNDRTLRRRGFASPLFADPWSMIRKSKVPVFRKDHAQSRSWSAVAIPFKANAL
jgi:hypothetical protein